MTTLVPSNPATDPTAEPQNMIDFAQQLRLQLANALTTNGNTIPTDPDTASLLLKVLSDSDRSELTRMKIKADEKGGEADRQTALILAAASAERALLLRGANPFSAGRQTERDITPLEPQLSDLPNIQVTPGLTQRGRNIESYDEFITRVDPDGV